MSLFRPAALLFGRRLLPRLLSSTSTAESPENAAASAVLAATPEREAPAVAAARLQSDLGRSSELVTAPSQRPRCLADLANDSPSLARLMSIGVDLSRAESVPGAAGLLASLDFELEAKPRLAMLQEFGCITREAAAVVSGFPKIFATPLPALRDRLDYLTRAGFVKLPDLVCRQPTVLAMSPEAVDSRLSQLQRLYNFENSQLVSAVTECPKSLTFPAEHVAAVRTCLVKGLQFTKAQAKDMVCLHPPLMVSELTRLYRNFALLSGPNGYKLPAELLAKHPLALVKQPQRVAARLRFLVELGRGQFDPSAPLYTSLTQAVSGSDGEFCHRVAACPPAKYRAFLKTL